MYLFNCYQFIAKREQIPTTLYLTAAWTYIHVYNAYIPVLKQMHYTHTITFIIYYFYSLEHFIFPYIILQRTFGHFTLLSKSNKYESSSLESAIASEISSPIYLKSQKIL